MIWIVDASVAVRWFIEEEAHVHAEEVLKRMVNEPRRFAVPELFSFEVFSVLRTGSIQTPSKSSVRPSSRFCKERYSANP